MSVTEPPMFRSMSRTGPYRVQHQDIDALITRLSQLLVDQQTLRARARDARAILVLLSGKLRAHLAMEDRRLYPALLVHPDPALRDLGRRCQAEMAAVGRAFFDYVGRWPGEAAVAADPAGFGRESREILRALAGRIVAEDGELFPAVDAEAQTAFATAAASGRATTGR